MSEEESLVLAALLHDIGELWQHSADTPHDEDRTHADLSHDFIIEHLGQDWSHSASLAAHHHQPVDYLSKLVCLADRLSLAGDDSEEAEGGSARQLQSVLSRLGTGTSPRYLPLTPLEIARDTVFPREHADTEPEKGYARLWEGFVRDTAAIARLYSAHPRPMVNTLSELLFRYAWCVPSSHPGDAGNTPLVHHLRTASAIAVSLYRSGLPETELDSLIEDNPNAPATEPYLSLIAGDVGGVQEFVYAQNEGATPAGLRGRALFVELLTETAARWLLHQLGLYSVNLLYVGAGRFYLLAPRVDEETVSRLRAELSRIMLKYQGCELPIALATTPLCVRDLYRFPHAWARIEKELAAEKCHPYRDTDVEELYEHVFEPRSGAEPAPPCAVCGGEGGRLREGEAHPECDLCRSLKGLGERLAGTRYMLVAPVDGAQAHAEAHRWQSLFRFGFGFTVALFEQLEPSGIAASSSGGVLFRLNSTHFMTDEAINGIRAAVHPPSLGFRLLAQPTALGGEEASRTVSFHALAAASEGAALLGVLRMDADDFASLLRHGLGDGASIASFCSLSFLCRLFFEGWVGSLCATGTPHDGRGGGYPVFAGGDDLFIVGSWCDLAELAYSIQQDFAEFCCFNPALHVSGCMVAERPTLALCYMADAARESLEGGPKGLEGKNALGFLGNTLGWSRFERVREWRDVLQRVTGGDASPERGKAPRELLHLLIDLHLSYLRGQEAGAHRESPREAIQYGPWMWQAAYHLSAMIEQLGEPAKGDLARIREALVDPQRLSHELPDVALAARWVELLTRKEQE